MFTGHLRYKWSDKSPDQVIRMYGCTHLGHTVDMFTMLLGYIPFPCARNLPCSFPVPRLVTFYTDQMPQMSSPPHQSFLSLFSFLFLQLLPIPG